MVYCASARWRGPKSITMAKQGIIAIRETCRVCGKKPLTPILSLGDLYVSDFIKQKDTDKPKKYPLELVLCNKKTGGCGLLQLKHTVNHESMYRNYWYRSGMNKTMTDALGDVTSHVKGLVTPKKGDYVIDIGANDGTLLRSYGVAGLNLVGFEPARNLKKWNGVGTTKILNDFFNFPAWKKAFGAKKAKAVTAIAMFYDLEDPNTFVGDVAKCLDSDGVFIIQMSYLPLMLEQNAFDNCCHEHLEYYSLLSLENLMKRHGLEVFDVELNDVNGGSFRAYMRHASWRAGHTSHGQKNKQGMKVPKGAAKRVADMRAKEAKLGLHDQKTYDEFVARVNRLRTRLTDFIRREVAGGKKVYVYGASTKGNTLLQFYGLDYRLITAPAERHSDKWGMKTVGTLIPIISEADARAANPHHFLVLPWHFMKEFKEREGEFLKKGGKFIVPLPEFKVIGHEA